MNAGTSNNERAASGKRGANQLWIHLELTEDHKNRNENAKKKLPKKASTQSDYFYMLKKKNPMESLKVMTLENAMG